MQTTTIQTEQLYTEPVLAEHLRVEKTTLQKWRYLGKGRKTTWHFQNVTPSLIHHTWHHLKRGVTYKIAVRATNALGNSHWLFRFTRTPA